MGSDKIGPYLDRSAASSERTLNAELYHPEPGRGGSVGSPDLVLVGHVGETTVRIGDVSRTNTGGSGYVTAVGASVASAGRVGLVTQVGGDFDLARLRRLGLNLEGVAVLPGVSARFMIDAFGDGTRSFRSELGVAASVRVSSVPAFYLRAMQVHLAAAPPQQQLAWLRFFRDSGCTAQISADMLESFVATEPAACREVCDEMDLIFMNELEHSGLFGRGSNPKTPMLVKRGSAGARLLANGLTYDVEASETRVVDPIGAGEILDGVFLALRAYAIPESRALKYAVHAATCAVEEFGVDGPRMIRALEVISREVGIEDEKLAVALVGDRLRLVSIQSDGTVGFLDPYSHYHHLLHVASRESYDQESLIEELEELINGPGVKEIQLQEFFERNDQFLCGDTYEYAQPHIILQGPDSGAMIPDFALKPSNEKALCDLLELKLPGAKLVVGRGNRRRLSSAVFEAAAQLREYRDFFELHRNRDAVEEMYGLRFFRPRMLVVIGKRSEYSPIDLRKAETDVPNLIITTYDDLVERARSRMRWQKGRRWRP